MRLKSTIQFNINSVLKNVFLIFFLFGVSLIQAQGSGNVKGMVLDKSSGDPLPGANVFLEGTSNGAATTFEGDYVIRQVPAGDYIMIVKYIGYSEQRISVTIVKDRTLEIDVELGYVSLESDEVVVSAQALGQIEAINQQLSSQTIKNVVSADRIQDVPDVNAAESVARLPGVSIIRSGGEGQKVAIRGLSPKYNVTMVNGVRMQSTDRDDRSVDLNMISSNMLSGIEVTKALTADMDADAVGGTVNLKIGKAAEGFKSKISLQGGYGQVGETYGNYKGTAFISNRFLDDKLGIQLSGSIDQFNRSSDRLSAGYILNETSDFESGLIEIDFNSATIVDRVTDRQRLGGGLVLDYKLPFGTLYLNNFISNLAEDQVEMQNSVTDIGQSFGAFGAVRELSNTVISNALQGEFEFSNIKMDFSLSNSISKQYRPGDLRMNIGVVQGATGFARPDLDDPKNATPSQYLNAVELNRELRVQRLYTLERDVTESAQSAVLNFEVPFNFSDYFAGNLKLGGKYIHNSRENDETQYENKPDRDQRGEEFVRSMAESLWTDLGLTNDDYNLGIRADLFADPDYDIGDFLLGEEGVNKFFYLPSVSKMKHFEELAKNNQGYWPAAQESNQYDYDYTRNLSAFYIAASINIGKYVTLLPGIRYESFDMDYNAQYTEKFGPATDDFRNNDEQSTTSSENWFPQLQLRIKPTDWLDVRLASTKSIIYPDYRSVSPYIYLNSFNSPYFSLGNPELNPALSNNYDIYASVYDNYIGLFTAGYFYKEIENLIVSSNFRTKDSEKVNNRVVLSQASQSEIDTWINLDATSTVSGFELDWQTHFWYLPSFLQGFVFNINYTHITSETEYPYQTSVKEGSGPFAKTVFVDSSRIGRMPDQPNDILNATLGYDIGGFSARLSFVFQDNVLRKADETYQELDSYTEAYYRWDLILYQKLPWDGLQVFFNFNNITNRPDREFVSVLEKLSVADYYGSTADLGIRYEF